MGAGNHRYRRVPSGEPVEAVRWNGANASSVVAFCAGAATSRVALDKDKPEDMSKSRIVVELRGHIVAPGNWIVRDGDGIYGLFEHGSFARGHSIAP